MKRYFAFLLILAWALALTGCAALAATPSSTPSAPSAEAEAPTPTPSTPAIELPASPPSRTLPPYSPPQGAAVLTDTEPVTASLSDGHASISLELPQGWEYTLLEGSEYAPLSLAFWPEGESGRVTLSYYTSFGVCGTGLTSGEVTFADGRTASTGTYGSGSAWGFLTFRDTPGDYVAMTEGVGAWWREHADTVMAILGSARLGEGLLTRSQAEAIARSAVEGNYGEADGRSRFDHLTGQWSIHLDSPNGTPGGDVTVVLDVEGNVLEIQPGE